MKYLAQLFFLQCVLILAVIQCGREQAQAPAPVPAYTPTPSEAPTPKPTKTPKPCRISDEGSGLSANATECAKGTPDKEKSLLEQNESDSQLIDELMRGVE